MQLRDDRPDIGDPNCWVVPGGHLEPGESPEDGARREFLEETGYRADSLEFVHSQRWRYPDGRTQQRFYFLAEYDEVQPLHCYEGQEVKFLYQSDLHALKTPPGFQDVLDRVLSAKSKSGPPPR